MNGGRTSGSRFLRTDDIRRYLEKKEFKTKSRRWSVCSDDSDSSALSDSSLRSLPQYSSYRALSAQGSLTTMSQISSPTSSLQTPSRLKQPSALRSRLSHKEASEGSTASGNVPNSAIATPISRENSFTKHNFKGSGIPTPTISRENSFTKIAKMKRESSLPSIKREPSKTSLKDNKKMELSSSEILKREKAPSKKEPAPVRPRQSFAPAGSGPQQISGSPVSGFMIGDRVEITGSQKKGVIQFIGETKFAKGSWAGIVLDEAVGKNDGSVGGVRYFQCAANSGVFVKVDKLVKDQSTPDLLPRPPEKASNTAQSVATMSPSELEKDNIDLKPGDRVAIGENRFGTLKYLGNAGFAKGIWCGVELDEPFGKNDGAVAGTRYFECQPKHGLFSPVHKVRKVSSKATADSEQVVRAEILTESQHLPPKALENNKEKLLKEPSKITQNQQELIDQLQSTVAKLEKEKSDAELLVEEEKRKCEDLQFQLEEQLLLGAEGSKEDDAENLAKAQEQIGLKEKEIEQLKDELSKAQVSENASKDTIGNLEMALKEFQRRETFINSNAESERANVVRLEELMQAKVKELEEVSFLSKEDIFNKEEEIKRLNDTMEAQQQSMATLESSQTQLQTELENLKEKEAEGTKRLQELEQAFADQATTIGNLEEELHKIKHEHAACPGKVKALESRLEHMRIEKESLENEMKVSIQTTGDHSEQLELLSSQIIQKSKEVTEAHTRVTELNTEKDNLTLSLEEVKANLIKCKEELKAKNEEIRQRDENLTAMGEEVKSADVKMLELSAEHNKKNLLIEESEKKVTLLSDRVDSILVEKGAVEKERDVLVEQNKASNSKLSNLMNKLNQFQKERDHYCSEVERLKSCLTDDTRRVDQLEQALATVRAELCSVEKSLSSALEDREATEIKYESACTERERVNEELEKTSLELQKSKNDTENTIKDLHQVIERERAKCEALDSDRLNLQNKVEQTLRQLQVKEGELVNVRSQVQDVERQLQHEKEKKMNSNSDQVSDGNIQTKSNDVKLADEGNIKEEINFLNSVIVDLQKKNKELETKLTLFEAGDLLTAETKEFDVSDLSESGLRPELRPRLFCDICDVFDEHDTEDCPLQSTEADNGIKHHGVRGEERPYCAICELFGHDTADCDDDEMF